MSKLFTWLHDPFGRKKITKTHSEILTEIIETTTKAKEVIRHTESFPISRNIGNPRLRKEERHA